jgi:hypothetical protein
MRALYAGLGPWRFMRCYLQLAWGYGNPGTVTIDGEVRIFAVKDAI